MLRILVLSTLVLAQSRYELYQQLGDLEGEKESAHARGDHARVRRLGQRIEEVLEKIRSSRRPANPTSGPAEKPKPKPRKARRRVPAKTPRPAPSPSPPPPAGTPVPAASSDEPRDDEPRYVREPRDWGK